jgi:DNA-binding NtrC family response regulator
MRNTSIMIVENNTDLRNTLRHAFEDRGYITWTCPIPEIAVSIFQAVLPSIVILDLDFEETNTLQLIDRWRQLAPQTRVIVESRTADTSRIRDAMAHGAHAFLTKPYALSPLFDLLEKDIPTDPPTSAPLSQAA